MGHVGFGFLFLTCIRLSFYKLLVVQKMSRSIKKNRDIFTIIFFNATKRKRRKSNNRKSSYFSFSSAALIAAMDLFRSDLSAKDRSERGRRSAYKTKTKTQINSDKGREVSDTKRENHKTTRSTLY